VLVCEGLRKSFGTRMAVDGVSFSIAEGETYGLLGPNGAGKTTTISMVCGLLSRDGGDVTVAGKSMDPGATAAKAAIGLVPQDVALYPDLSARENLRFFGRLQGLTGKALDERVVAALEVVGLSERADERVERYSGGMKRRANIAAGLLHRPRLLVLDEPTVGVDPQSRNAILESVEVLGGQGLSVLYTTHYMEEAERLCHRIGILDEGRLVAEGTRRELVDQIGEHDRLVVGAVGDLAAFAARCAALDGVEEAAPADSTVRIMAGSARQVLPRIVEAAEATRVEISSIEVTEADLEAVFLHLTGKALRD
jgi:ABC-2 type transport system ATP-binding protein